LYVFIVGSNAGQALTCLFLFISWVPTPFTCFPLSPPPSRSCVPSRLKRALQIVTTTFGDQPWKETRIFLSLSRVGHQMR
jgi:hypothetical protein